MTRTEYRLWASGTMVGWYAVFAVAYLLWIATSSTESDPGCWVICISERDLLTLLAFYVGLPAAGLGLAIGVLLIVLLQRRVGSPFAAGTIAAPAGLATGVVVVVVGGLVAEKYGWLTLTGVAGSAAFGW